MVVLGILLLVLVVAVAISVAVENDGSTDVSVFGQDVSGLTQGTLFLAGLVAGVLAALALGLVLAGLKRRRTKKLAYKRQVSAARSDADNLAEENARLQDELARKQAATQADSYPTQVQTAPTSSTETPRHGA